MGQLKYKWVTVKEAVELVLSDKFDNGGSLDFTLDKEEIVKEYRDFLPTGWYGIARVHIFDGDSIVIGYYGGGIEKAVNCLHIKDYPDEAFEDTLVTFLGFLNEEGVDIQRGKCCEYTETSLICIDESYPNKC